MVAVRSRRPDDLDEAFRLPDGERTTLRVPAGDGRGNGATGADGDLGEGDGQCRSRRRFLRAAVQGRAGRSPPLGPDRDRLARGRPLPEAFDTKRQEGNLGAGILSRFRVVFDYSRSCLWLEPGPDLGAPFPKDRSGLALQWGDGALTVEFVAPASPAAEAGWKEGERLAALDGEPAGENWWKTFTKFAEAKAGTEARFTLADGTERKLVLKEYY